MTAEQRIQALKIFIQLIQSEIQREKKKVKGN
jgi:hypothetical protein